MSTNTESLRDIYMEVTGEETITEHQQDERSRDPIEHEELRLKDEVTSAVIEDGLDDAVEGAETEMRVSE